jgi:hypothetical protein
MPHACAWGIAAVWTSNMRRRGTQRRCGTSRRSQLAPSWVPPEVLSDPIRTDSSSEIGLVTRDGDLVSRGEARKKMKGIVAVAVCLDKRNGNPILGGAARRNDHRCDTCQWRLTDF